MSHFFAKASLSSVVAVTTGATVLVSIITIGVFWTYLDDAKLLRDRRQELGRLATLLSTTVETNLQAGELTATRRMLIDVQKTYALSSISLELPDGQILAASDPSRISLQSLPDRWAGPIDVIEPIGGGLRATRSIVIPRRGALMLTLTSPAPALDPSSAPSVQCTVAMALVATLIQLLVYRSLRRKIRSLSLIQRSLHAIGQGEQSADVLELVAESNVDADAWNKLLARASHATDSNTVDRAKAALGNRRESKIDLASAIDGLPIGVVVMDSHNKVCHANGVAAALLRRKREEVIGIDLFSLIDDQGFRDAVSQIVGGAPLRRTIEVQLSGIEAASVLRIHLRPLRKDDAGCAILTLEDVTQQRIADSARNDFVAQATHELRTPLTNMRLCLEEALETEISDPKQVSEHLNLLNKETRRLERLVGDMLSVSEIEAGSLKLRNDDVRLDRLIEDLRRDFEPQASEKAITLQIDLPPKMPVLLGDRDKIMITLQNLLGNALKYTPGGGQVTLGISCDAVQMRVRITDTGIGISPQNQAKLFRRFFRASDDIRVAKAQGTGLGLALAREVARLHGGDITVESALDQGSTFTLSLPVAPQAQAA